MGTTSSTSAVLPQGATVEIPESIRSEYLNYALTKVLKFANNSGITNFFQLGDLSEEKVERMLYRKEEKKFFIREKGAKLVSTPSGNQPVLSGSTEKKSRGIKPGKKREITENITEDIHHRYIENPLYSAIITKGDIPVVKEQKIYDCYCNRLQILFSYETKGDDLTCVRNLTTSVGGAIPLGT